MKNKKNRSAYFICSLSFKDNRKKMITKVGKIQGTIAQKCLAKTVLVMIQYLFQKGIKSLLVKCHTLKR